MASDWPPFEEPVIYELKLVTESNTGVESRSFRILVLPTVIVKFYGFLIQFFSESEYLVGKKWIIFFVDPGRRISARAIRNVQGIIFHLRKILYT